MKVTLEQAFAEVDRALLLAESKIGPTPKFADSAWFRRREEVLLRCAADLKERVGARITDRFSGCSVRIAGVSSTCTAGMHGALRNWMAAARRRLDP